MGMPSFESEHRMLVVYDCLIAFRAASARKVANVAGIDEDFMFIPRLYGEVAFRSAVVGDHELVALHDDPDAVWSWRPLVYRLAPFGMTRLGSQQELQWRWGLAEVERHKLELQGDLADLGAKCAEEGKSFEEYRELGEALIAESMGGQLEQTRADARAAAILREHLNAQQRIDLEAAGHFFVRGQINRLYRIEPGNGAAIVHPETRRELVSICLHPERWMPHDDVALATKLLIESGADGEREMLEGGRSRYRGGRTRSTRPERRAWELERDLLPAPLQEVTR